MPRRVTYVGVDRPELPTTYAELNDGGTGLSPLGGDLRAWLTERRRAKHGQERWLVTVFDSEAPGSGELVHEYVTGAKAAMARAAQLAVEYGTAEEPWEIRPHPDAIKWAGRAR